MGLARDLSMGPKKQRASIGQTPPYRRLRALTARENVNPDDLADAIRAVSGQPGRMRFAEGAAYNDACARYRDLTGRAIGPATATY